jgi:hypothetical protein
VTWPLKKAMGSKFGPVFLKAAWVRGAEQAVRANRRAAATSFMM